MQLDLVVGNGNVEEFCEKGAGVGSSTTRSSEILEILPPPAGMLSLD